uniref:Acetyl-CoA carboxylase central domain-containing protein n=1 Tax=Meloidogyne floridensis TaxID=298350 RepID=A0A915PG25_9BILA
MEEWDSAITKDVLDRGKSRLDTRFEDLILLPYALFKVFLYAVESRICRMSSYSKIKKLISNVNHQTFPANELAEEMESYLCTLNPTELGIEKQYFESLIKICERFGDGLLGHLQIVISEFLENFIDIEHHFQDVSYDKGVSSIKSIISDPSRVVRMVYSHTKVLDKNVFLKELLSRLDDQSIIKLQMPLKRIANMFNQEIEPIAIYIRRILNKMHQLSYSNLCSNIRFNSKQYEMKEFISLYFNNNEEFTNQQQYLRQFIKENNKAEYLNLLHEFFFSSNEEISKFAIKLFFSKLFLINEENVNFYSKNKDAMFFKFELNSSSPYFNCRLQQQQTPSNNEETSSNNNNGETENQNNKAFNYYITVINNIDSFDENCRENFAALDNMQISTAKINVEDTFLFIIKYNEKQNENCEECAKNLKDWFTASLGESTLLQNKIFELLDGACGEIRVSCAADKSRSTFDCNHVFIRLEYDTEIGKRNTDYWPRSIEEAIKRCEKYLIKHRITEVEVNYEQLRPSTTNTNSTNITESQQQFETIRIINEDRKLIPIESGGHARLAGKSSATPHHTIQQVN